MIFCRIGRIVLAALVLLAGSCAAQEAPAPTAERVAALRPASRPALPKQVYALHFPHHRTREHDGALGAWQKTLTAKLSKARKTSFNYNPDLIDATGRHQIAATVYPYVGMQSDLDPDYQEFQILTAKAAHIDAFILDWILPGNYGWEHTLRSLLKTAEKLDFKIGIDFIASSHFDWYQGLDPEADTRAKKAEAIKKSLQYALDHFYSQPAALVVDGHAILFLFGGTNPTEHAAIRAHPYRYPPGVKDFWHVQRASIGWKPAHSHNGYRRWADSIDGCFGWLMLPHRLSGKPFPPGVKETFDYYIDSDDMVIYQNTVTKMNDLYYRKGKHKIRVSAATPGFDNRGCAGWNRTLALIPREQGRTYRRQWEPIARDRDKIDAVFCVTWNDYTEATTVEPTVEFGFDDMEVTQKYAAEFKGIESDPSGIRLPARLFKLRKKCHFLSRTRIDPTVIVVVLDKASQAISAGRYAEGARHLEVAEQRAAAMARPITSEKVSLTFPGPKITAMAGPKPVDGAYQLAKPSGLALRFDEPVAARLRESNFDGYLTFEYLDEGTGTFTVRCSPARPNVKGPRHVAKLFSEVCRIRKDGTGKWVRAKVKVFKVNARFDHKAPKRSDIVFFGDATVRNIALDFEVFTAGSAVSP